MSNRCCAVVVVVVVGVGVLIDLGFAVVRKWLRQFEHVHLPFPLLARRLIRFDADVLILATTHYTTPPPVERRKRNISKPVQRRSKLYFVFK